MAVSSSACRNALNPLLISGDITLGTSSTVKSKLIYSRKRGCPRVKVSMQGCPNNCILKWLSEDTSIENLSNEDQILIVYSPSASSLLHIINSSMYFFFRYAYLLKTELRLCANGASNCSEWQQEALAGKGKGISFNAFCVTITTATRVCLSHFVVSSLVASLLLILLQMGLY